MKDFWGNEAIDSGDMLDLMNRYKDKLIVTVVNRPFGESCVIGLFERNEHDKANNFLDTYHDLLRTQGITGFGTGVTEGADIYSERMRGFQGGAML